MREAIARASPRLFHSRRNSRRNDLFAITQDQDQSHITYNIIQKASPSDSRGDSLGAKFLTVLELEDSRDQQR